MNNKKNAGVLIATGAVFLAIVLTVTTVADASRNSSGTMSAANGPYVPGTTITSTTINSRFADIENEITDSLSRSGKGGMTAALRGSDGTVSAPEFSFTNEVGTGIYRIGANDLGVAIAGTKKLDLTATGLGVGGAPTDRLSVFPASDVDAALMAGFRQAGGGLVFGVYDESGGSTTAGAGSAVLKVGNTAGGGSIITTGAVTIGASGTAISASYRGTVVWNPGNQAANSCVENNITVTGAVVGAECAMSQGSTFGGFGMTYTCYVTATNVCTIRACNVSTALQAVSQGTYACRVFNP